MKTIIKVAAVWGSYWLFCKWVDWMSTKMWEEALEEAAQETDDAVECNENK